MYGLRAAEKREGARLLGAELGRNGNAYIPTKD